MMRIEKTGLFVDNPAIKLLDWVASYEGVTTALGAANTVVCDGLINEPNYSGHQVALLAGPAAGQAMRILTHIGNTLTVAYGFTDPAGAPWPVAAGTSFVVLKDSGGLDIAALVLALLPVLREQPDTAVTINAIAANEVDVLNLATPNTRYVVRSLRLKCANPGANTCTVRLYELVNNALTQVDSFDIIAANFATFHSLMDMFGMPHLAGDQLQITVQMSAGGAVAVTGQYSHALAT